MMSFLAKRGAYCPKLSASSQSAISRVAELRLAANATSRFGFNDLLDRAFAGLLPTLERFFIASALERLQVSYRVNADTTMGSARDDCEC